MTENIALIWNCASAFPYQITIIINLLLTIKRSIAQLILLLGPLKNKNPSYSFDGTCYL